MKENCLVAIKRVKAGSNEDVMTRYFSTPGRRADKDNSFVPVYDILYDAQHHESLIVQKYLRPFNDPGFATVGEVVDMMSQSLQVCGPAPNISKCDLSEIEIGDCLHSL